jgi:hypothetical protein
MWQCHLPPNLPNSSAMIQPMGRPASFCTSSSQLSIPLRTVSGSGGTQADENRELGLYRASFGSGLQIVTLASLRSSPLSHGSSPRGSRSRSVNVTNQSHQARPAMNLPRAHATLRRSRIPRAHRACWIMWSVSIFPLAKARHTLSYKYREAPQRGASAIAAPLNFPPHFERQPTFCGNFSRSGSGAPDPMGNTIPLPAVFRACNLLI